MQVRELGSIAFLFVVSEPATSNNSMTSGVGFFDGCVKQMDNAWV